MKTISLFERGDAGYEIAATFAKRVYRDELEFILDDPPELFLGMTEDRLTMRGAIGLNRNLTRSLFLNDRRVMLRLSSQGLRSIAEQSVLALDGATIALPIFFAALAALAHARGIDRIVFAGIDVSLRTLAKIGFVIEEICPADPQTLRADEKENYVKWFRLYTPIICTVETAGAKEICEELLFRWRHRVICDPLLARKIGISDHLDAKDALR